MKPLSCLRRPQSQKLFIFNEQAPVNDCASTIHFHPYVADEYVKRGSLKIKAKQLEGLQDQDQHPLPDRGNGTLKEVFAFQLVSIYCRL